MCSVGRVYLFALVLAVFIFLPGCLGNFAENQARRQAARSADYYTRTYATPEMEESGADPAAVRQARDDMADTIVRSGNPRQKKRVVVNERGYLDNAP